MQAFSCSVCACIDAEAGPVLGAAAPSTGMGSETCAPGDTARVGETNTAITAREKIYRQSVDMHD